MEEDFCPVLPTTEDLVNRAKEWKELEQKYRNIEEELDDFGSYEEEVMEISGMKITL